MFNYRSNDKDRFPRRKTARAISLALSLAIFLPVLSPQPGLAEDSSQKSDSKPAETKAKSEKKLKAEKKTASKEKPKEKKEKKASSKAKRDDKQESASDDKPIAHLSILDQPESVIGLPASAAKLINQGRWREASQMLEARVKKDNDVNRDNAWLAFAYLYLGKNDELKKLAEDTEKQAPKSPYALIVRAFNLTSDGKFEDAEKLLLTLPPQFAGDPLPNFALALVTAKQGKAFAATAYCQKSVELDPQFAWGYRTLGYLQQRWLEDVGKAEEAYAKALSLEPGMAEAQDALTDLRLSKNDFDGAIDVAKRAIKVDSKSATNHYRLAQIYTEQWRLRDALVILERAIDLDPKNARFYRSRATIKSFQGNLKGAIADQQQAVDLSKDKAFELIELSNMNVLAGNNNRAVENLQEALKLEPDNQTAHDKLARIFLQEKRYDDLVQEGKRVAERKPKDLRYRMEYAMALSLSKRIDEAIEQYKLATELTTSDPEPFRRLGALYIGKKDWTSAQRAYTRALNINSSSVADLAALGFCYAEDGDYRKAEAAFVTALALTRLTPNQPGPSAVDLTRSLAGLMYAEGRYGDAVSPYENIYMATRMSAQGAMDFFALVRAKAMRDLTKESGQNLLAAYQKLNKDEKEREAVSAAYALVRTGLADQAIELLQMTPVTDRNRYQHAEVKVRALAVKGQLDEAIKEATKSVEMKNMSDEQKSDAWFVLSELQYAKKDMAGAEASANKALESYVKSPEAYVMLGQVALQKNDAKTALSHVKRALDLNPYYPSAYILQGDAQMKLGSAKDARDSYQRAVQLYPASMEAHRGLLSALKKLALSEDVKHEEEQITQLESLR